MADFKEVKLNPNENKSNSSNVERLDDYPEAEFKGATLSLSQEAETPMISPNENSAESISPSATDSMLKNQDDNDTNMNTKVKPERALPVGHRPTRPMTEEEVRDFFAEGALENAAEQCRPVVLENLDGELRGVWLLTEIDHWDTEKERVIFLTDYSLIILKYDFITQRLLDYRRIPLATYDHIVVGELKYPENSLMPLRNQIGVKLMWNSDQPLPFLKNWNPWCREIPWLTYTSHPLAKYHQSRQRSSCDVEDFSRQLVQAIEQLELSASSPTASSSSVQKCEIQYQPVVVENYAGIASAFHNANDLGFFKARGKVSF